MGCLIHRQNVLEEVPTKIVCLMEKVMEKVVFELLARNVKLNRVENAFFSLPEEKKN